MTRTHSNLKFLTQFIRRLQVTKNSYALQSFISSYKPGPNAEAILELLAETGFQLRDTEVIKAFLAETPDWVEYHKVKKQTLEPIIDKLKIEMIKLARTVPLSANVATSHDLNFLTEFIKEINDQWSDKRSRLTATKTLVSELSDVLKERRQATRAQAKESKPSQPEIGICSSLF
jgi:hypothetical protein